MTTPVTLVDVVERLVERDHLMDQHRAEDGTRPPLTLCPADPCVTWKRFLAGRLP